MASGILNALPPVRKKISVANFSKKPTRLSEGVLIVVGTDGPDIIVYLDQAAITAPKERKQEGKSVAGTVAGVQYTEKKLPEDQVDRHKEVETVNHNNLHEEWRANVNFGAQYIENR